MKKFLNKKITLSVVLAIAIILIQNSVFAAGGQAKPGGSALYSKTATYFFELIRQMESSEGTLGKRSNIEAKYIDTSKNGIDCHMEKSTEYGAITLLASSAYGNATSTASASTGANNTGVFGMNDGKYEYVANIYKSNATANATSNSYNGALTSADERYVDVYIGSKSAYTTQGYVLAGDGLIETDGWGGSTNFVSTSNPVFRRGDNGFFGCGSSNGGESGSSGARAVVVCGKDL